MGLMKKHWLGSKVTKGNNILKILITLNIYLKLIVVSHRGLFLDLCERPLARMHAKPDYRWHQISLISMMYLDIQTPMVNWLELW